VVHVVAAQGFFKKKNCIDVPVGYAACTPWACGVVVEYNYLYATAKNLSVMYNVYATGSSIPVTWY
jgi:hypothetical protein